MRFELMNLDLGTNPHQREFSIGSYRISLVDSYDTQQASLSQMMKLTHEITIVNGEEIKKTTETPARVGKNTVTAYAECYEEPEPVISYIEESGIGDVCVILSYLTGRRVFLPEHERFYQPYPRGFYIVPFHEIPQAASVAWTNRRSFSSQRELRPLWYYLSMNDVAVTDIGLIHGCVALEIIQNLDENKIDTSTPKELEELISLISKNIEESSVTPDVKQRLKGVVVKWGKSGSQQAFKNLLKNYGIVDDEIQGVPLKRIGWVNTLRNGVVHSGELREPKWIKDASVSKRLIAFMAKRFIPALVVEYLNRKFQLQGFESIRRNTATIKEYIYKGTCEGEKVEETKFHATDENQKTICNQISE